MEPSSTAEEFRGENRLKKKMCYELWIQMCIRDRPSPNVSKHHGFFRLTANGVYVEDLNSTNGLLFNGTRVASGLLREGDIRRPVSYTHLDVYKRQEDNLSTDTLK